MASQASTPDRLLEREGELAALRDALSRPGSVTVLEGPAGVGKTALIGAARTLAEDSGLLVLEARGAELEQAFAFGVVRQLFEHAAWADAFTGAARFAAPLIGVELEGVAAAPPDDPFAARHALYWLTANLAAERPLALFVDDAHWADAASLGVIAHLANRVAGIPVALIVASREAVPGLESTLRLAPLGEDAAAVLVRSIAPGADDAVCRACHAATGGNPFLLHELARSMVDGAVSVERVAEQSPERVTREIASRLAALPEHARALAGAASVLGDGVALRRAAALAGIELEAASDAADALVAAEVLRTAHPLAFLHPLIGAAVYAGQGPAARARDHGRAARLLADEGESPERVAAQLLRAPPAADPWAFDRLDAAARQAGARGAADAVATYLLRALEEPPPPERRADVLLELGTAECQFNPEAAVGHLREALASDIALERRFQATMLLAAVLAHVGRVGEAADVVEDQFHELTSRPDLRGPTEAALANITRIDPVTRRRADRAIERMRRRVDEGERDPAVLGTIAAEMGMAGEPADRMNELAEAAILGMEPTAATAAGWSWYNGIRSLIAGERYDIVLRGLDDALERARERGAPIDIGGVLVFRAELFVHMGDLGNAEVDARTLHEISDGYGWVLGRGTATWVLGEVLIERGELDEAEAVLFGGPYGPAPATVPHVYSNVWVLWIRGLLRLAMGRPADAAEELRECGRRATAIDNLAPSLLPWRSDLAHALLDLGETAEARWLAIDELGRAHALGGRRSIGVALRAAARVEGGAEEIQLLREATTILEESAAQLERARAAAALGFALHRGGDAEAARDPLRRAIDLAHRCSAQVLEDAALAELRATGARPRRRLASGAGALTPSERRIAELAASGSQNREIAETLFVTTATVEYHLRNAYRKLGIASRAGLAEALA
jgi:DNA-binding CsgD family transcriptional regulator